MQKIKARLRKSDVPNLFHDTRGDVAILTKYCNMLADKVNELIDELEKTKAELARLKGERTP